MNIGMFTNAYLPILGGLEQSIATFVEDLRRLDQHVFIVTLEVAEARESDETTIRLPAVKEVGGTTYSVRLPMPTGLGRRLDALRPDIVHSHHPFMLGDTALRVARARGLPLVFTHHTLYERYTYQFRRESEILEHMALSMATEYANLCDRVIAPTESIRAMIRDRGVHRPIDVIPTGVDTEMFAHGDGASFRQAHGIPPEARVLGYLGRVVEAKNIDFLTQAAVNVLHDDPEAWYLVVGDGDSRQAMERDLDAAGVAQRVVMTGSLTGQAVADAYAAMDLFAFASHTETQGIVLIESLAAGVPVVALETRGPQDIVEHGRNGLLIPPDASPAAFAQAITSLLQDRERRAEWSAAARQHARDFDRRRTAQQLLQVYQELSRSKRAHSGEPEDPWAFLQSRFAAEWDLFREKLSVIAAALGESEGP